MKIYIYYNPNLTMDREDFSESNDLRGLKEGRITVQWRGDASPSQAH